MNPQSLNKYSYCFNNPLKFTDPTGNWPNWLDKAWKWVTNKLDDVTISISININFGIGKGYSFSGGIAFDFHGGVAVTATKSEGVYLGIGANIGAQVQVTNAGSVENLRGSTQTSGGSFNAGLLGGANLGGEIVKGENYTGNNYNFGAGVLLPVESHAFVDQTYVTVWRHPRSETTDISQQTLRANVNLYYQQ